MNTGWRDRMSEHTETPWVARGSEIGVIDQSDTQSYGMMLVIAFMDEFDFRDQWKANARHIVHCVNNHERLVEALRNLVDYSECKNHYGVLYEEQARTLLTELERTK